MPSRVVGIAVVAFKRYREQQMTDRAAALTYFAMMSLFPALLVGVSLLGLFGQQGLVQDASNYLLEHGADETTADVVRKTLQNMISASSGALGATLLVSIALALNGASGAFGAAGRALDIVYEVAEGRGFVRRKLTDLIAALVVIVLFAVVVVAVFLGGQVADDLFGKIGLGETAASVWSYARWPMALVAATVAYGLVYRLAPDIRPPAVRWITAGAIVGVVLWLVLSVGFAIYIRNFATYGAAYGAFGAAIVLLLWLYLSANAFLFGAEVNAELQRSRAVRDL
ncbi:MAG TPA: YihY/virulence factor BrkB family protein [Solirubrobacteraceae bacterium]|nr:YihY/virulence factor BrkB family protein [Solirubrobacteraceae bacterium]